MDTTQPPDTTSFASDARKRRQVQTLSLGILVVAVGLAGIWWFGVRDASSGPVDSLFGDWRTVGGTNVAFTEDGWSAQHRSYGEDPFDWGSFTFDGETLTFFTDAGSSSCEEGQTGGYRVTISDDKLAMERIEDPCPGRSSDFFSGMTREP